MTTEYASADDLFGGDLETADVELPGGRRVKVRGMSRYELHLSGKGSEDSADIEAKILTMCVVEPALTAKQAEAWLKSATPGALAKVLTRIRELSGLAEGADKSDVAPVRD
jgi:hypothetical protein